MKLQAQFLGLHKDLFICLVYITPERSSHKTSRDNIGNFLRQEIAHFATNGDVMLTGDFNACTGGLFDFVPQDSCDHIPLPPDYTTDSCVQRTSQDSHHNAYGYELVDICQSARLRILNSRRGEDQEKGLFTCMTPRGNSVVDYTIVSENLLKRISNFKIDEISTLSDHCSVSTSIVCGNDSMVYLHNLQNTSEDMLYDLLGRYEASHPLTLEPSLSLPFHGQRKSKRK